MCPAASGYQNNKIILTLEVFIDIHRDHFLSNWPIAAPAAFQIIGHDPLEES